MISYADNPKESTKTDLTVELIKKFNRSQNTRVIYKTNFIAIYM